MHAIDWSSAAGAGDRRVRLPGRDRRRPPVAVGATGTDRVRPRQRQQQAQSSQPPGGRRPARSGLRIAAARLLTLDEERTDIRTRELRFDIRLLADRLLAAMDELDHLPQTALPLGLFGASTGAAAALIAAAERPSAAQAVVSR